MKRSFYFISADSLASDIVAAGVAIEIREQFPYGVPFGFVGPNMVRSKVKELLTLEQIRGSRPCDWPTLEQLVDDALVQTKPKMAILVGFSEVHRHFAGFFKPLGFFFFC